MRYIALACVIGLVACTGDRKCVYGPYVQVERRVRVWNQTVLFDHWAEAQHKRLDIDIDSVRTCQ